MIVVSCYFTHTVGHSRSFTGVVMVTVTVTGDLILAMRLLPIRGMRATRARGPCAANCRFNSGFIHHYPYRQVTSKLHETVTEPTSAFTNVRQSPVLEGREICPSWGLGRQRFCQVVQSQDDCRFFNSNFEFPLFSTHNTQQCVCATLSHGALLCCGYGYGYGYDFNYKALRGGPRSRLTQTGRGT